MPDDSTSSQPIVLEQANGEPVRMLRVEVTWPGGGNGANMEVEALGITVNVAGRATEIVGSPLPRSSDGAIEHTELPTPGTGGGEALTVDLTTLNAQVQTVWVTLGAAFGLGPGSLKRASCRLVDVSGEQPVDLVQLDFESAVASNVILLVRLDRQADNRWRATRVGTGSLIRSYTELLELVTTQP